MLSNEEKIRIVRNEYQKKYQKSDKGKASYKKYAQSDKGKLKRKEIMSRYWLKKYNELMPF